MVSLFFCGDRPGCGVTRWSQKVADLNFQDGSVRLGDAAGLFSGKSDAGGDGALQAALRRPVGLKLLKLFQGCRNVTEIGLARVVQQAPQRVLRSAILADADGVLGDAVKLPSVASEAALVRQRVGNVGNQNVSRVRKQRPEADAGEGCYRAI
jgi:hypothetical protein